MRAVFDTNVLLDAIIAGRADGDIAKSLLLKAAHSEIDAIITANTITDIYYVAKKAAGDAIAREAIANIMNVFCVVPVAKEDCANALSSPYERF